MVGKYSLQTLKASSHMAASWKNNSFVIIEDKINLNLIILTIYFEKSISSTLS